MTTKNLSRKLLVGGSVGLAAAGLTTCDNGAVDPAPAPLQCGDVVAGQTLSTTATLSGTGLFIEIWDKTSGVNWKGTPTLSDLQGVKLVKVDATSVAGAAVLELELETATTAGGKFTFEGALSDRYGNVCAVKRTLSFTIDAGKVQLAQLSRALPLSLHQARIEVVRREGQELELRAHTGPGARLGWTVSAG